MSGAESGVRSGGDKWRERKKGRTGCGHVAAVERLGGAAKDVGEARRRGGNVRKKSQGNV